MAEIQLYLIPCKKPIKKANFRRFRLDNPQSPPVLVESL